MDALTRDPIGIIRTLDQAALRERLHALEQERKAILSLLRAVARIRRPEPVPKSQGEISHA